MRLKKIKLFIISRFLRLTILENYENPTNDPFYTQVFVVFGKKSCGRNYSQEHLLDRLYSKIPSNKAIQTFLKLNLTATLKFCTFNAKKCR